MNVLVKGKEFISHVYEIEDLSETHMNVKVYEINSWSADGLHIPSYDDKELVIDACIKWDGCSHFNFGDETGYLHVCGKDDYENLKKVIDALWKLAEEKIVRFDGM